MLDDDDVRPVLAARGNRRHQRQRVVGNVDHRQAARRLPGKRIEQRGHEGRKKTARLRHRALKRGDAARDPVSRCQRKRRGGDRHKPNLGRHRRPGGAEHRGAGCEDHRNSAEQHSGKGQRILHHHERCGPREQKRQIRHDQFQSAVPVLDMRCGRNRGCQDRRQQDGALQVCNDEQQHCGIEAQCRDRKCNRRKAALCQPDDADGCRDRKGQNHRERMPRSNGCKFMMSVLRVLAPDTSRTDAGAAASRFANLVSTSRHLPELDSVGTRKTGPEKEMP